MLRHEEIADRFIKKYNLSFERARELANEWAEKRGKLTTGPFYGNANDWEEIELLRDEMYHFCAHLPSFEKHTLLLSGHVITINVAMPIVDIVGYCMYRALARTVWQMVEKMK